MSSKPKLPPKEAIVTRHKAALWNTRQLRRNEASVRKIAEMTQMLRRPVKDDDKNTCTSKSEKSPPNKNSSKSPEKISPNKTAPKSPKKLKTYKSPKSSEKIPKKIEKSPVIGLKIQNYVKKEEKEEFQPRMLKRVKSKKIILKPKHELKIIGSKRKISVPHKGIKSPPHKRCKTDEPSEVKPVHQHIDIEDIIRITEEQGLTDEDFLEILTCESPVWWEEPPDEAYIEEAIFRRNPKKDNAKSAEDILNENDLTFFKPVNIPDTKQMDKKFIIKRNKLENVLGNIKDKLSNQTIDTNKESQNSVKKNNEKVIENHKTINNMDIHEKNNQNKVKKYINKKKSSPKKRCSESTEEDPFLTFRDDKILQDLENMDIPMNTNNNEGNNNKKQKSNECADSKTIKITKKAENKIVKEKVCAEKTKNNDTEIVYKQLIDVSQMKSYKHGSIPKMTITSIEKCISSPSGSDADNSSLSQDLDSISDTNIKFIEEDASSINSSIVEASDKNKNESTKNADGANDQNENVDVESVESLLKTYYIHNNNKNDQKRKDKEYMTVYKIISSEDVTENQTEAKPIDDKVAKNIKQTESFKKIVGNEAKSGAKVNLNSFYKKCKINYNRRSKTVPKNVAQNEVNHNNTELVSSSIENEVNSDETSKSNDNFCESCEPESSEKSIVISDQNIVKYCLKCSCIFESETCSYCDKRNNGSVKNSELEKNEQESVEGSVKNGELEKKQQESVQNSELGKNEESVEFKCGACNVIVGSTGQLMIHTCFRNLN